MFVSRAEEDIDADDLVNLYFETFADIFAVAVAYGFTAHMFTRTENAVFKRKLVARLAQTYYSTAHYGTDIMSRAFRVIRPTATGSRHCVGGKVGRHVAQFVLRASEGETAHLRCAYKISELVSDAFRHRERRPYDGAPMLPV